MIVVLMVALIVTLLIVVALLMTDTRSGARSSADLTKMVVALHDVRRRLQISQLRTEVRADALLLRRELERELRRETR